MKVVDSRPALSVVVSKPVNSCVFTKALYFHRSQKFAPPCLRTS